MTEGRSKTRPRNGARSWSNSSCAALPRRASSPRLGAYRAPEVYVGCAGAIPVPRTVFHQGIVFGGFECLAQPGGCALDRALLDEDVIAPDLVEQLGRAVTRSGWVMKDNAAS